MSDRQTILIIGVSTRSAAASCVRAGLHPICLDLFGDRDLRGYAEVHVLDDLVEAHDLLDRLGATIACDTPVMYVGGVENCPALIELLESRWNLWGCSSQAVRAVRDPIALALALRRAGLPALEVQRDPPTDGGDWLQKPLRSGGGLGIEQWHSASTRRHGRSDTYFQEYRAGQTMSALFIAASDEPRRCELLGICRQLIGEEFLNALPFGWCGSIGPVRVDSESRDQVSAIGTTIHSAFHLAGLFGIDFVLDAAGVPWVTEVNPRYTGSTEVLELALDTSFIQAHAACFRTGSTPPTLSIRSALDVMRGARTANTIVGKAVLFAAHDMIAQTDDWPLADADSELPLIVDVPVHGQHIPKGGPVCTILVKNESALECLGNLRPFADRLTRQMAK